MIKTHDLADIPLNLLKHADRVSRNVAAKMKRSSKRGRTAPVALDALTEATVATRVIESLVLRLNKTLLHPGILLPVDMPALHKQLALLKALGSKRSSRLTRTEWNLFDGICTLIEQLLSAHQRGLTGVWMKCVADD